MNHPHLTELFQIYTSETQPFRKVHRMIDLFESLIKMHTVVIISAYIKQLNLSDSSKGMLAQGLRTPSLGTWQLFSRVLFDELEQNQYEWKLSDFSSSFKALDKALNASKTNVIAFRNGYAHGATPTDEQCEKDIKQFEPFLIQLFKSGWLSASSIQYRENRVWITADNYELCLHPILLFKEDGGSSPYAFFNDLKNDKVGLLNYPLSKHYREKDFYNEFHQYLPLNEWKKIGNSEFDQRIEELTESFKGRTIERDKLLKFVLDNNKGYISIQGNPGIGKSALVSQFLKDLKPYFEIQNLQTVEYFIRRGTAQAKAEYLLNYLLRKTDELFSGGREVRADGKEIWDLQQQLFSKWRLWGELNPNRKLLFLIDGLDEAVENDIVTYLPRETFDGILFVYGSRPGGHKSIDDLWTQLPVEYHSKLELLGLGKADIRALIYEVVNKYEIERESQWVDAIENRSQGNPLYLKLLCDAMSNGLIPLNDTEALPHTINDYYKAILDRYAHDPDGDALLCALYTFAAARDYLTITHLGIINKLGEATLQRISSTLKEVLYENPFTEHVLDYQLFHESFREYLVKEKKSQVNDASERIIDFCSSWKSCDGLWEQRYPLEYYSEHLADSKKEERTERLIRLIYDEDFIKTQQNILEHYGATSNLYKNALQKASDLKRYDDAHEAALCLIDLKYEEANDAPKIVALVAKGEIDLVLKRIESFGDADTNGLKRKFNLYMLCLLELTLLESKNKPFNKIAIEKILNHFDENIPIDHEQLNWNDFFSSYLIFLMACEWKLLGIDYLRIYKRANVWNTDWVVSKAPYSETQFEILYETIALIGPEVDDYKLVGLKFITTELVKLGKAQKAIEYLVHTNEPSEKSRLLLYISDQIFNYSKNDESEDLMQQAIDIANRIEYEWIKGPLLGIISTIYYSQGKFEQSQFFINAAFECICNIEIVSDKSHALKELIFELIKQEKIKDAYSLSNQIDDDIDKSFVLSNISHQFFKLGEFDQSSKIIQEAIFFAKGTNYEYGRSPSYKDISTSLYLQGDLEMSSILMQKALECARNLIDDVDKAEALMVINNEINKQGKYELSETIVNEIIEFVKNIDKDWRKSTAFSNVCTELAKNKRFLLAQFCATSITDIRYRWSAIKVLSEELAKNGDIFTSIDFIHETLRVSAGTIIDSDKNKLISNLVKKLIALGELDNAIYCVLKISDEMEQAIHLKYISSEMYKSNRFEESKSLIEQAIASASRIMLESDKDFVLKEISIEYTNQNNIKNALEVIDTITDQYEKDRAIRYISVSLAKQLKFDEALDYARGLSKDFSEMSLALKEISDELANNKSIEESQLILQEAFDCALIIEYDWIRIPIIIDFVSTLARFGKIKEVLEFARSIQEDDQSLKCSLLMKISTELLYQDKLEESNTLIDEAIENARVISVDFIKIIAFLEISTELAKQAKLDESMTLMEEALRFANKKGDSWSTYDGLKKLSIELVRQGKYSIAEKIVLGIENSSIRYSYWELISQMIIEKDGFDLALNSSSYFLSDEAKLYYLRTWAQSITVNDITKDLSNKAILVLSNDSLSLEHFMQVQAQYEILYGSISDGKMNRLNKTLNIQWLIDIISKFPKKETFLYTSTNVSEWIALISDVDDREEIELLARKVSKGKMTEEDFSERIKSFIN